MIKTKQRTISNMTPKAQAKARALWEKIQDYPIISAHEHDIARDSYHRMFRQNYNFVQGVEAYTPAS